IRGGYHIDFATLERNHDGFISREEAKANPTLAREFDALDAHHRGRLDQARLKGWMKHQPGRLPSCGHSPYNEVLRAPRHPPSPDPVGPAGRERGPCPGRATRHGGDRAVAGHAREYPSAEP